MKLAATIASALLGFLFVALFSECGEDLSNSPTEDLLPGTIATSRTSLLDIRAIAGG